MIVERTDIQFTLVGEVRIHADVADPGELAQRAACLLYASNALVLQRIGRVRPSGAIRFAVHSLSARYSKNGNYHVERGWT